VSLVDIAVNLTSSAFDGERGEVLMRALAAGVGGMLITGSDLEDSAAALALAARFRRCAATAGVHPHNARHWDPVASPGLLYELVMRGSEGSAGMCPVAVGECGLDYDRDFSPRDDQRRCFADQLDLAVRTGMPVFLHERAAFDDFAAILGRYRGDLPGAVVHCFTGGECELDAYLAMDCHIGITGWICDERRGSHLIPLVARIPADRLLLETDSPYLLPRTLPRGIRGKGGHAGRNEPGFLPHVAEFVAGILGESPESLAERTTANAVRLFGAALSPEMMD